MHEVSHPDRPRRRIRVVRGLVAIAVLCMIAAGTHLALTPAIEPLFNFVDRVVLTAAHADMVGTRLKQEEPYLFQLGKQATALAHEADFAERRGDEKTARKKGQLSLVFSDYVINCYWRRCRDTE